MKLPQLALRDLFWLVLVAALVVGWAGNRNQLVAENERLRARNRAAAERSRIAAHQWWIEAIKQLGDVDRLMLLAKLAAEQPRSEYELLDE